MLNRKTGLLTLTIALSIGVGPALASPGHDSPDGHVHHARAAGQPARAIECVAGATLCPEFPRSLRAARGEFLEQLKDLSGCAVEEETGREHKLRAAGDAATVTEALAHLLLADPSLSLHDIKNAIALIAEAGSDAGLPVLREVYDRSRALVARTIDGGPISRLGRHEQDDYVARQAEDLRRVVVLAVARDDSAAATALLRQAMNDRGRSVVIAATRAVASRRQ